MGNHNSGRRPKPSALKLLQGNPGKRKLNEAEPKPPEGSVSPPEGVSKPGLEVWAAMAPIALAMGTLTTADVAAFARYCELEATARLASKEKDREGFSVFLFTTMVDSAGNEHMNVKEHPAIKMERDTAAALRPYYSMFGFEACGRAKISVPTQKPAESKWAEMGLA